MAKRRRLDAPSSPLEIAMGRAASSPPPIAQVAGEASSLAAAESVVNEMEQARAEGRMIVAIPMSEITVDHLVRDRMSADDDDMAALRESIRAHGQRTPIEVVKTDQGYGLISGWRRMAALNALYAETHQDSFARIKALIRAPQDAGEAYVAMVEENEIRVGLSYYERARIAVLAAERGAFADTEAALSALYANVSRAKRSKIRSFVAIHAALGDALQFPAAIPERLGLRIAGALKEGGTARLKKALSDKADTSEAEAAALDKALSAPKAAKPGRETEVLAPGVFMELTGKGANRRVILSGPELTDQMVAKLRMIYTS